MARLRRHALATAAASAAIAALVIAWSAVRGHNRIDDDAYMFVRYARNLSADGVLAWNPSGPPVYGLTSLAHFAVVAVVNTVLRADPAIVLVTATTAAGIAFLAFLSFMAWRAWPHATPRRRMTAVALTYAGLAWPASSLLFHFTSGMDTTLALAWVAGLLCGALAWEARGGLPAAVWWGVAGGASLWVRPDLVVFGIGVAAVCALVGPPPARRRAVVALAVAIVVASALAGIAWLWLGSPLPLALQAKVTRGYGADMQAVYAGFALRQLGRFVLDYAAFFVLALTDIVWVVSTRAVRRNALDVAVAVAATAFIVFHAAFVLPIMGDHQRFDYPTLPAIVLLALRAVHRIAAYAAARGWWRQRARVAAVQMALVVAGAVVLGRAIVEARRIPPATGLRVLDHYRNGWPGRMWARLDRVAALPDGIVIATTEVGMPGVLNPGKQIVDLAGLHDAEFARHGFSSERLFARGAPDLFYLTVRHYETIRGALLADRRFAGGYELLQPPGGLTIALRRDSPYYASLRTAIVAP